MFLLILSGWCLQERSKYFNTSHVSINQRCGWIGTGEKTISIHLMFLLIRLWDCKTLWYGIISIHLMFLLITVRNIGRRKRIYISIHLMFLLILLAASYSSSISHFNTSHVSINPYSFPSSYWNPFISIHLMFLLIAQFYGVYADGLKFQYISCFY